MDSNCGLLVFVLIFQLFGNAFGQDFNQAVPMGSGGNSGGIFNFNPGSGHASEIMALQSGLSGTAVDMSQFPPPPFVDVPPPAPVNNQPDPPAASVPDMPAPPPPVNDMPAPPIAPPAIDRNTFGSPSQDLSPSTSTGVGSADPTGGSLPDPPSIFSNVPTNFNFPSPQPAEQPPSFSNLQTNFNVPPPASSQADIPSPSGIPEPQMFGLNDIVPNNQGIDNTNYNILDVTQNNSLNIDINRGGFGEGNAFNIPNLNNNNQASVGNTNNPAAATVGNTGMANEQSLFEESMFSAAGPQGTGLVQDTGIPAPSAVDQSQTTMFDMEMGIGAGTPGETVNPQPSVASSQTNNQFNNFNRIEMSSPSGSRFGVVGSRFGSFSMPNNIGKPDSPPSPSAGTPASNPPTQSAGDPLNVAQPPHSPSKTIHTPANEPHVNDLNSEGIYPFEGNMVAMDATLPEGGSAIQDMNRALIGHEPLHLESSHGLSENLQSQGLDPVMNNIDMVGSSSNSDLGSSPLTDPVGLGLSKANSGGMAVSDFNPQMHDFSSVVDNSGSSNSPSSFGGVQPDATAVGNQDSVAAPNNMAAVNVGGSAIGSQTFDFGSISLPEKAFLTNQVETNKPKQPEAPRDVKVDLSNFLPPPFIGDGVDPTSNAIPDFTMQTNQFDPLPTLSNKNPANEPNTNQLNQMPPQQNQPINNQINLGFNQGSMSQPSLQSTAQHSTVDAKPLSSIANEFNSIGDMNQGHHVEPVVGSIFGSSGQNIQTNSSILTKKLLEKSGMTREPNVDFMTSFLNNAQPSRTFSRGNENLQIVPFGSDISTIGTQSNNMIIVGQNDARTVDQFGIADIYTRQNQLNPSQWKQLMDKVSQDAKPAPPVQNNPPTNINLFNYVPQNVIGTSETKPLASSLPRTNTVTATRNSPPSPQAMTRTSTSRQSSGGEFTMFAAPGMTGHKSVTIPNFSPQRSSFSIPTNPAPSPTPGNVGLQQPRNEFASNTRTNNAAPSMFNQGAGASNVGNMASGSMQFNNNPMNNQQNMGAQNNMGVLGGGSQSGSIQFNNNQFNNQGNVAQPQQPQFGPSASQPQTPGDMNTFSLGQSLLISDGTVPEFTRPSGNILGMQVSPGASPNLQTLGQPAVRSNTNSLNSQSMQRVQPGGQSVMSQFNNNQISTGLSQQQPQSNPGTPISFPSAGLQVNAGNNNFLGNNPNMNTGPMVPGQQSAGQVPGQAAGGGAAPVDQPMSPTLFTSGNRLAVFGPAHDISGRRVNSRQDTPVPATRVGVLAPVVNCRYLPDPTSQYYFIYKNGLTQHRFRCALGTAFDEMTCECSIRVSDHGDCLEVHMDFNEGVVVDSSLNRLPIGNENVEVTNSSSPIAGIALFGGDSKLTIWRYQNYDFRDHVMLKVQFRAGVGGQRYQPLISNCDGGLDGPSMAIVYDNLLQEVMLILKTDNDTRKQLTFSVNPDEWNDVTYIYDGQEFIGIVNGVRRYVSKENPHLLGIIGGVIKSAPTQGLVEIRDAAIVLGHCPKYGYFRGAMVDIQIYTCIPKDFRLE